VKGCLLALLFACKVPPEDSKLANARAFKDMMCGCKDPACADKVTQGYLHFWDGVKLTKELDTLQRQITECAMKAQLPDPKLPLPPANPSIEAVIAAATAWQVDHQHEFAEVHASYVDASGQLDAQHGNVSVYFIRPPIDDPHRKTGAPVAPSGGPCESALWQAGGWRVFGVECETFVASHVPNCTVVEIWKRAIADGAPTDALAVITFARDGWIFDITDDPRNVHIRHTYPDNCERALESP
jgi:hypothetical protein